MINVSSTIVFIIQTKHKRYTTEENSLLYVILFILSVLYLLRLVLTMGTIVSQTSINVYISVNMEELENYE